jgi:hypothetical protein
MTIKLTEEKANEIKSVCHNLLVDTSPTIRAVARVTGKIIATFPGVMHGPLYYRYIEKDKCFALKCNKGCFDKHMTLSSKAKAELEWWTENIMDAQNNIYRDPPLDILTTDASNQGWGAVYKDQTTGGLWSSEEKLHHINYLELLAAFIGLQTFCSSKQNSHIRLMIDNSTAVAVVNHRGTSHSDQLNELAVKMWHWCID